MQTVAGVVLPTFTFYGMYKSHYNTVRDIEDNTLIVEPPRQWPLNPRDTCQAKFTAKVWIGIRHSIKPATDGVFEYPPFNEIDIRDTLVTAANTFVTGLNSHTTLQVINDLDADSLIATIFDAPEGQSTNWQSWINFTVDIVSYGTTGIYSPTVYAPGISNVTQYTLVNGATLPTGIAPDLLYIDTGTVTDDIETTPYDITVPTGYLFTQVNILSGVALTGFLVYDKNDTIIATAGAVGVGIQTVATKFPTGESLFYEHEYQLGYIKATGNTSPGFRAIFKLERSML